jgi:hypothetical protein
VAESAADSRLTLAECARASNSEQVHPGGGSSLRLVRGQASEPPAAPSSLVVASLARWW